VGLKGGRLEVRREPSEDPSQRYGFGYATLNILDKRKTVTPLAMPGMLINVSDLFP